MNVVLNLRLGFKKATLTTSNVTINWTTINSHRSSLPFDIVLSAADS